LRLAIIFFFMCGALGGAYLFRSLSFHAFLVPVFILIYALVYDILRIRLKQYYQHWKNARENK
jgi:uncharacterized membrane protein YoaK (UPF0700 family)